MDGRFVVYVDQGAIETLVSGGQQALEEYHELRTPGLDVDRFLPWHELGEHAEDLAESVRHRAEASRWYWRALGEIDRLARAIGCFENTRAIDGRWPRGSGVGELVRFTSWFESDFGRMADGLRLAKDAGIATVRVAPESLWAMQPDQPVVRAAYAWRGVVHQSEICPVLRSTTFALDAIKLGVFGHSMQVSEHAFDILPLVAWWELEWLGERPRGR